MSTDLQIEQAQVCISIATFRRPDLLASLLESVEVSVRNAMAMAPRIIVVDNDPEGSAARVVEKSTLACEYIHEPRPGIVAARNAALKSLLPRQRWIVFVDDDETVAEDWYARLLGARELGAAVVSGPVIPVYPESTPSWIVRGGFFERPRLSTGSNNPYPATNNTLVDRFELDRLDPPRFDESYSETGGSDSELFARMRAQGARILWCDEAIVYEVVPAARANFRWIWRRNIRLGNVARRVSLGSRSAATVACVGSARAAVGAAWSVWDLLTGGPRRRSIGHLAKGIGMVQAAFGRHVREYSRQPPRREIGGRSGGL